MQGRPLRLPVVEPLFNKEGEVKPRPYNDVFGPHPSPGAG